jgi:hypothetical protein
MKVFDPGPHSNIQTDLGLQPSQLRHALQDPCVNLHGRPTNGNLAEEAVAALWRQGSDTAVFIGNMFNTWKFNNGWWTDDDLHYNTCMDSHAYQVFFEKGRAFTPRQHIAYVCRHNHEDVTSCCYEDAPNNTIPAKGISRIVGEWSAAYDSLPTTMAPIVMKAVAATGEAPYLDRTLSAAQIQFMRNFVEAQMVAYEAKAEEVSSGWLFWNFKME